MDSDARKAGRQAPILPWRQDLLGLAPVRWLVILLIGGSVALYKIAKTNRHPIVTSREISPVSKALPLVLAALFWVLWLVNVWRW